MEAHYRGNSESRGRRSVGGGLWERSTARVGRLCMGLLRLTKLGGKAGIVLGVL